MIAPFIAEMCLLGGGGRTTKADLFKAYEKWAEDNKENSVGSRTFTSRIQELDGVSSRKSGSVRSWDGIRLRDARDADPENSAPARAQSNLFENGVCSVPSVPTAAGRGVG